MPKAVRKGLYIKYESNVRFLQVIGIEYLELLNWHEFIYLNKYTHKKY